MNSSKDLAARKVLSPVSLEMEGFWSFKEKAVVTFPRSGPVLISGTWKGSAVSSGSGKSAIPRALAFALGIGNTPATELKNWDSKKMRVVLTLTDGENMYGIIRDPKLSISINGQIYGNDGKALSKSAEEKLEEILGAKLDLVSVLVDRAQREFGRFLNDTDSENKEFLSPLLGLSELENAIDNFEADITWLETQLTSNKQALIMVENDLAQFPITIPVQIAETEDALAAANLKLFSLQSKSNAIDLTQELGAVKKALADIGMARMLIMRSKDNNATIRATIERLNGELNILKQQTCYTCNREWNQAQSLVSQKLAEITRLLDEMKINLAAIANAEPILASEPEAMTKQSDILKKLGELSGPLESASAAQHAIKGQLDGLYYQQRLQNNKRTDKTTICQKLMDIDQKLVVKNHSLAILKGFMGSIFDEILQAIQAKTNRMIAKLPNMNGITFKISSSSVTQKGKVKKAITKQFFKFGKPMGIKNLSGGQRCALELFTDLAVRYEIIKRSGLKLGWISLDEAMYGLDTDSTLAALEVLRQEIDGLILVIDHATEIKEGFEKIIKIEYNGRESYVTAS